MEAPVSAPLPEMHRRATQRLTITALCALLSSPSLAQETRPVDLKIPSLEAIQGQLVSSDERALHLLISHAELPTHKPSGAPWDYGSGAPDALLSVRYPKLSREELKAPLPWGPLSRVVTQESAPVRDEYVPVWLFSLSFVDLVGATADGVQVELFDQDPIGRQHIDRFVIKAPTREQVGSLLSLKGPNGATLYFEWRALARARRVTDVTPIAAADLRPEPTPVKPLLAADHREAQRLYRSYISAQLKGDHLGAQQALLLLTQRYTNTRYGRKALRLLAPLAR